MVPITIKDGGFLIAGVVKEESFWANLRTLEDIFFGGMHSFHENENGQIVVYGKSCHGSPTIKEDGCPQDACIDDCNCCHIAQRRDESMILPKGVRIWEDQ